MSFKSKIINNKFLYYFYKKFKIFKSEKFNEHLGEFGEDIFISRFFKNKLTGNYVDIGCYHPIKGSLTYNLFQKGWRGINVDLSKVSIDLFKLSRPKDINIQAAITDFDGETFYYENGPINQQNSLKENSELKKIPIKAIKLSTILKQNNLKKIEFLNIDVEGFDFKVLSTLDFSEIKPTMICIEENNYNAQKILETNTHKYLQNNGYFLASKIGVSLIYIDQTYENKMNELMSL
tara:strand:+ start:925 stop:1629 length:705 start_codon:yes stop_codon:yes gene_type:complete